MLRSGTKDYFDPDKFQAGLPDSKGVLALTGPGTFTAQQTWITLNRLYLLLVEEALPRIAYLSLPSDRIQISFPSNPICRPIWCGIALRAGEIVFHGHEQGAHDRTSGPMSWGLISMEKRALAAHAKYVAGREITSPQISQILRPSKSAAMRLVNLHRKACRLAAKKPELFVHVEVARALENELLEALFPCLIGTDPYGNLDSRGKKLKIMADFEAIVRANLTRPISVPNICSEIGVAERTLRAYCTENLGMSPHRYLRLRRLNVVRSALLHSDPSTTTVQAVARHYQFNELGRFAGIYRESFGESPLATLSSDELKSS